MPDRWKTGTFVCAHPKGVGLLAADSRGRMHARTVVPFTLLRERSGIIIVTLLNGRPVNKLSSTQWKRDRTVITAVTENDCEIYEWLAKIHPISRPSSSCSVKIFCLCFGDVCTQATQFHQPESHARHLGCVDKSYIVRTDVICNWLRRKLPQRRLVAEGTSFHSTGSMVTMEQLKRKSVESTLSTCKTVADEWDCVDCWPYWKRKCE